MPTLNRMSFFRPALEAAIHMRHIAVSHLPQSIRSERGTSSGHAVHDDVMWRRLLGPEAQYSRSFHGLPNHWHEPA